MGKLLSVILSFALVLVGILYRDTLEKYFYNVKQKSDSFTQEKSMYTPEQLKQYNGVNSNELYLAILGTIFDVSKGIKHYGDGSPYNYFVGKDGSRAFITGNFKDDSSDKDHVLDLTCGELLVLLNWKKTLKEKYRYAGKVIGRYFNQNGKETEYMHQFYERIDHCEHQKEKAKQEEQKYPPCNISWNAEEGTTVWCTKSSGGITRSWTGVPRQFYTPGKDKPQCVCIDISRNREAALFKEYENCSSTSTLCHIRD